MKIFLVFSNVLILGLISLLHFYWAGGGKWAYEGAIPEQFKERARNEKYKWSTVMATLLVAVGLLSFVAIILSNYFPIELVDRFNSTHLLTRVIGAVFLLRALGDFKMVGLFKKYDGSLFAQRDSIIYIPLCLFLGISAIVITML